MSPHNADPCFTLKYVLKGDYKDSITTLAFSDDGKYMACSSFDGNIVVYNMNNGGKVVAFRNDSPPAALCWGLGRELVAGLNDGTVIIYYNATQGYGRASKFLKSAFSFTPNREHDPDDLLADLGKPIATMSFQPETRKLFVAFGASVAIFWHRSQTDWVYICTINPPPFEYTEVECDLGEPYVTKVLLPRMKDQFFVCYRDHGIRLSFGLRPPGAGSNNIYRNYRVEDTKTSEVVWSIPPDNRICPASLSPDNNSIIAWNLNDGLDFYCCRYLHLKHIETLDFSSASNTEVNLMIDVQYILDGKAVLVGSNVGTPFIVHVATKEVIQTLKHSSTRAPAPINAYWSRRGQHYIATADRDSGVETTVKIWYIPPSYGWLGDVVVWPVRIFRHVSVYITFLHLFLHLLLLATFVPVQWSLEWRNPVVGGLALIGRAAQTLSQWAERMEASDFDTLVTVSVGPSVFRSSETVIGSSPMNAVTVAAATTVTSTETVTVMAVMPADSTAPLTSTHPLTCAAI
ncbi:hypothetical protein E1B28_005108 [Marasmius oreades]|uniref:Uncharacterized protein n=1 Tax=Marasmius oreades TaxID=181124 RepID=A0A9P7V027_9AGAR|nr:uncharacterized protein E1B28_005108 [Marasmius oreades]KAG7097789.1 hypothetical protein E1B28_005108 [Marasmius oreades]